MDRLFWKRVWLLIKKVVPSWTCIESQYLVGLSVLLVIRTVLSIWLADVNGRIVQTIVEKNWPNFVQRVSGCHNLNFARSSTCFYLRSRRRQSTRASTT